MGMDFLADSTSDSELLTDKIPGNLSSQELRAAIRQGWIDIPYSEDLEAKIQPGSIDAPISDECIMVPPNFRPPPNQTIREAISNLPRSSRERVRLDGTPLRVDCAYLIRLEGTFTIPEGFVVRSSPKSTTGRRHDFVRLVSDFEAKYDQFDGDGRAHQFWILVQPEAYDSVVRPGDTFNQLRIFCGPPLQMTDEQLRSEIYRYKMVLDSLGKVLPVGDVPLSNGLELPLDLRGESMNGVVALRAKRSACPVDLRDRKLPWTDFLNYHDVVLANSESTLEVCGDDLYLMCTDLTVSIPPHLCAEMLHLVQEHGNIRSHKAGFFDPGFGWWGGLDLATLADGHTPRGSAAVYEVDSLEKQPFLLYHGQALSKLVFYAMRRIPDKLYGQQSGSHYQGQKLRPASHWCPIEISDLAGEVDSDLQMIGAVSVDKLFEGYDSRKKFIPASEHDFRPVIEENLDFYLRSTIETPKGHATQSRPDLKQPIAYVVLVNPDTKEIFMYQRSARRKGADAGKRMTKGEPKLYSKQSIGVGGHVRQNDAVHGNPLAASRDRELDDEVSAQLVGEPVLLGYVRADDRTVDRDHFGLIYVQHVEGAAHKNEDVFSLGGMYAIGEVARRMRESRGTESEFETWSRIIFPHVRKYVQGLSEKSRDC